MPGSAADAEVRLSQARAFAKQAEIEGMPASAAYWQTEAQRLAGAQSAATNPLNRTPTTGIVAACVIGSLLSISVIGGAGEDDPVERLAAEPPKAEADATIPTATTATTAPRTTITVPPSPSTNSGGGEPVSTGEQVYIARIVDGDTVELGDGRSVRLLGIDTPEVHNGAECWGRQASTFARETLGGENVRLVRDPTQDRLDKYGRTLAYLVLPGDRNYSVMAARSGAAFAYTYDDPVRLAPQIEAAEAQAQAAGKGVWGAPCFGIDGPLPTADPPSAAAPEPAAAAGAGDSCEPGYDPCVPSYPPDLNCGDLDDGPYSVTGALGVRWFLPERVNHLMDRTHDRRPFRADAPHRAGPPGAYDRWCTRPTRSRRRR